MTFFIISLVRVSIAPNQQFFYTMIRDVIINYFFYVVENSLHGLNMYIAWILAKRAITAIPNAMLD